MNIKDSSIQLKIKIPQEGDFPELKILDYQDIYDLVTKFIQNVILIKDVELTIIRRTSNKISFPKLPFILLQIIENTPLPDLKTYYVNKQKISLVQSEIMMNIMFFGNEKISSGELAQSFNMRFNKGWATEQFAQYSKVFVSIYSNNSRIKSIFMRDIEQFKDKCSVDAYFEIHSEIVE